MNLDVLKLWLVTHHEANPGLCYKTFIRDVIEGGVTAIQVRAKSKSPIALYHFIHQLKTWVAPFGVPIIVNDNVILAKMCDVAGVHLGQSDLSPHIARSILGPNKIIGLSIETLAELEIANSLSCINYVAASAVFETPTKTNCKTIWGLTGLREFTRISRHPVVAIGGINDTNVAPVIACGVSGVAVINALHASSNPHIAAQNLSLKINHTLESLCLTKLK